MYRTGGCPSHNSSSSSIFLNSVSVRTGADEQSKYTWISELGHGHGHAYLANRRNMNPNNKKESILLLENAAAAFTSVSSDENVLFIEDVLLLESTKTANSLEISNGSEVPHTAQKSILLGDIEHSEEIIRENKQIVKNTDSLRITVDADCDLQLDGDRFGTNFNGHRTDSNRSKKSCNGFSSKSVNFTDDTYLHIHAKSFSTNSTDRDRDADRDENGCKDVDGDYKEGNSCEIGHESMREIDNGVGHSSNTDINVHTSQEGEGQGKDLVIVSQFSIPSVTTSDKFSILLPITAAHSDSTSTCTTLPLPLSTLFSTPLPTVTLLSPSLPISTHGTDPDQLEHGVSKLERMMSGFSLSAFPSDSYSSGCGEWGTTGIIRGTGMGMGMGMGMRKGDTADVLSRLHSYGSDVDYGIGIGLGSRSVSEYGQGPGQGQGQGQGYIVESEIAMRDRSRDRSRSCESNGGYDFYKYGDVTDDDTIMSGDGYGDGDGDG